MTNPVHVLTVAALLLVAFLIGAVVGTAARLIALRLGRKPVAAVTAPAETAPIAPPLVAAPIIAPLPIAPVPVPTPPDKVPVPDFAATLIALANEAPPAALVEASKRPGPATVPRPETSVVPEMALQASDTMQPAHVAGETTSGVHVSAPRHDALPEVIAVPEPMAAQEASAEQPSADVILFPSAPPEPLAARPTQMVVGGESVAIVDTSDFEEEPAATSAPQSAKPPPALGDNLSFPRSANPAAPRVELPVPKHETLVSAQTKAKAETIPIPLISPNAAVGALGAGELPLPEVITARPASASEIGAPPVVEAAAVEVAPASEAPTLEPVAPTPDAEIAIEEREAIAAAADPAQASPVQQEPERDQDVAAVPDAPVDEDAAMRAIEGNWSPRRSPPRRPARPVPEPEGGANQAVAASARAVTAARRTAEAVVAEVAEVNAEAGRPVGLDGPRDGRKDDLTHVIGVLPVIETALNTLGIYHFEQLGSLSDENIRWIEGHLGIPGRIGRELWREQARELSAVLRPKRVAEK